MVSQSPAAMQMVGEVPAAWHLPAARSEKD
jgi:hypothetical protein